MDPRVQLISQTVSIRPHRGNVLSSTEVASRARPTPELPRYTPGPERGQLGCAESVDRPPGAGVIPEGLQGPSDTGHPVHQTHRRGSPHPGADL